MNEEYAQTVENESHETNIVDALLKKRSKERQTAKFAEIKEKLWLVPRGKIKIRLIKIGQEN